MSIGGMSNSASGLNGGEGGGGEASLFGTAGTLKLLNIDFAESKIEMSLKAEGGLGRYERKVGTNP
jgi:hypothetical protein